MKRETVRARMMMLELAVSVEANVREANVMPELKQAARQKLCRSQNRQLAKGLTV
jgi:hypothetical protein